MNVHLVLPDLFWPHAPADAPYAGLDLAALERVFARGRRTAQPAATLEAWLAQRYDPAAADEFPYAPYSALGDGLDPAAEAWLRADPCHLRLGTDQLVLADAATFDIDAAEADALVAALNAHFAPDGLTFLAARPDRWYVRLENVPAMTATPLAAARGRSIDPLLPRGADGRTWHARLNEVQMVLHTHPVNEARESRGAPPVNSVWPWGSGRLPDSAPRRPFARVRTADPLATGLAMASGAATYAPAPNARAWLAEAPSEGVEAIIIDALRVPAAWGDAYEWRTRLESIERHWIAPLLDALREGRIGMLTLHAIGAGGSLQVETTRQDLRYFWRRPRPLAAWLEAAALPA
jgi:hypothetical protein